MNSFQIHPDVKYTVDINGVAVVKEGNTIKSFFFKYPQAAVWLLFIDKPNLKIAKKQVKAVLSDGEHNPKKIIAECIENWKEAGLLI